MIRLNIRRLNHHLLVVLLIVACLTFELITIDFLSLRAYIEDTGFFIPGFIGTLLYPLILLIITFLSILRTRLSWILFTVFLIFGTVSKETV